ncbi:MAG: recombinase family protein [Planctomycetota bacterium]
MKRIKELYRKPKGEKRMGFSTIARKLNQEGIPTRSGVPWSDTQVRPILARKRY